MISLKQDREEDHQRDGLPKYEKTRVYLSWHSKDEPSTGEGGEATYDWWTQGVYERPKPLSQVKNNIYDKEYVFAFDFFTLYLMLWS